MTNPMVNSLKEIVSDLGFLGKCPDLACSFQVGMIEKSGIQPASAMSAIEATCQCPVVAPTGPLPAIVPLGDRGHARIRAVVG